MKEPEVTSLREEVLIFANRMEQQMARKDKVYVGKKSYKNMTLYQLYAGLVDNAGLVDRLYVDSMDRVKLSRQLVHLANRCMMLHERLEVGSNAS